LGCAIFGSPTHRPFQDKKTALTKNGILKIMVEKKEMVNGMHFLQQAYCQNCGITSRGKILLFSHAVGSR
jgi:hypothetical protein